MLAYFFFCGVNVSILRLGADALGFAGLDFFGLPLDSFMVVSFAPGFVSTLGAVDTSAKPLWIQKFRAHFTGKTAHTFAQCALVAAKHQDDLQQQRHEQRAGADTANRCKH